MHANIYNILQKLLFGGMYLTECSNTEYHYRITERELQKSRRQHHNSTPVIKQPNKFEHLVTLRVCICSFNLMIIKYLVLLGDHVPNSCLASIVSIKWHKSPYT